MDFRNFPRFLGKSGVYLIHPPKSCAGLVRCTRDKTPSSHKEFRQIFYNRSSAVSLHCWMVSATQCHSFEAAIDAAETEELGLRSGATPSPTAARGVPNRRSGSSQVSSRIHFSHGFSVKIHDFSMRIYAFHFFGRKILDFYMRIHFRRPPRADSQAGDWRAHWSAQDVLRRPLCM